MSSYQPTAPTHRLAHTFGEPTENHVQDGNQDQSFINIGAYCNEEYSVRNECGPHICVLCGLEFDTWADVIAHMQVHDTVKNYTCPQCEQRFDNEDELEIHTKIHIQEYIQNPYDREISTLNLPIIGAGMGMKNGEEKITPKCTTSGKGFRVPSSNKKHRTNHQSKGSHKCTQCGNQFVSAINLYKHMLTHAIKLESYGSCGRDKCPLCSKTLQKHQLSHKEIKSKANASKPFKCCMCNKRCKMPAFLKNHMKSHTGRESSQFNSPQICTICNKDFFKPVTLRRHLKIHSVDNSLKCTICNKPFRLSAQLNNHVKVHTSWGRPFCYLCRTYFTDLQLLTEHMLIHETNSQPKGALNRGTNSTDFSTQMTSPIHSSFKMSTEKKTIETSRVCYMCKGSFTTILDLAKHVDHAIQKYSNCEACVKGFLKVGDLVKHLGWRQCI